MKLVKASESVESIQYRLRFIQGQDIFVFSCDENGENVKIINKERHDLYTLLLKNKVVPEVIKCIIHTITNDIVQCGCGQEFEVEDIDNIECFCGAEYTKDGNNFILKETKPERFIIRDREAGNVIEHASSIEEAADIIKEFEEQDKKDGTFVPNFYEIVDLLTLIED